MGADPPSCTFLCARYAAAEGLTVGWLGDCRAYAIGSQGTHRLTTDHSWGSEAVAAGRLTQAEADRDDRSHAITRWLGADAGPLDPDVVHLGPVDEPTWFVLCSDGAWNYLASVEELAELVQGDDAPLEVARRLVAHAIAGGGHDNITAVVAHLDPADAGVTAPATTIQTEPS